MRVMIADDEVHICSLIKHLISWEALNLEFAGLFFNGKEVLDFLTHNVADILICDIEMPGMSGIELMENLSKIKPELQIIVISGFRNFEYAHTSMKYGVKYYLLKPVDEKELNEALEAIITSSKKEERIESTISITSVRLQLIDVLNGTQKMDELKSVNVKYHFEFQEGAFNVLQVILSGVNPNSDYMPLMMRMLADILRPKFLDFCYDVEFFCVNAVSMYIIINYSAENEKIIQTTLDCMLQDAIVELGCKTQSKCF
ncbi:MAG: response regulator, partial [Ruthenibacterium sp.]